MTDQTTDEQIAAAAAAIANAEAVNAKMKTPPKAYAVVDGQTVDASMLPSEPHLHAFSPAFRIEDHRKVQRVGIDMDKAREAAKEHIRAARLAAFAKNDAEMMRAHRTGDKKLDASTKAKGQQLADATADERLTKAKTPDELYDAMEAVIAEL